MISQIAPFTLEHDCPFDPDPVERLHFNLTRQEHMLTVLALQIAQAATQRTHQDKLNREITELSRCFNFLGDSK